MRTAIKAAMWAGFLLSWATSSALGFSTNNTTITRTFNKTLANVSAPITVTVTFTNFESALLRGFYYADQIPQGLTLNTISVRRNGAIVSNYTHETGAVGDVYSNCVVHRWILETPSGFTENNPVTASGGNAQIVYSVTSASQGDFNLDQFHWVGYYAGATKAAFGYSENSDKQTIGFHPPDIALAPGGAFNFGSRDTSAGPTLAKTLRIVNEGAGPLSFTGAGVALTGANPGDFGFTIDVTTATPLAPGCTATVSMVFDPVSVGAKTTSLTVTTDDPDEPSVAAPLNGQGVSASACDANPMACDFGFADLYTTSTPQTVTVQNKGSQNLVFSGKGFDITGPAASEFTFATQPSTATIVAGLGQSRTAQLVFRPHFVGARSAQMSITTNDPESPMVVTLTGRGVGQTSSVQWRQY